MSVRRNNAFPWPSFAVFVTCVLMLVTCSGCGGSWSSNAAHSLEATAALVNAPDRAISESAKLLCGSHRGDHDALAACYHEHHLDVARDAIHTADASLRSAQAELDAANAAHDEHRWQAAAPCLAKGVKEAFAAIEAAGVTVPPMVDQALMFLGLAGQCGGTP